jgi:hypothetical protein
MQGMDSSLMKFLLDRINRMKWMDISSLITTFDHLPSHQFPVEIDEKLIKKSS